ncbi:MAG: GAF domain-containing protein [Gemmatimonadaceae bacterium]
MSPTDRPPIGNSTTLPDRDALAPVGLQAHGVGLVVDDAGLTIQQVTPQVADLIGWDPSALLGFPIDRLGPALVEAVRAMQSQASVVAPHPMRVRLLGGRGPLTATMQVHRVAPNRLLIELDDLQRRLLPARDDLTTRLSTIVGRLGSANSLPALAEIVSEEIRLLTGYDRVGVHRLDEAGHGEVIAESRRRGLTDYLHRRFPSTTVPVIGGDRLLRRKCFLLSDASQAPMAFVPDHDGATDRALELSLVGLAGVPDTVRARLRSEGILATFEAALTHEGRLWGVISCQHHAARHLPFDVRAACELIAEVVSTRISALEHYAEAQAEVLVRRLEHRLIEATGGDGDWRRALFEAPRQLLQPLGATGAALLFDGEITSTGEVPALSDLRALFSWLDTQEVDPVFATAAVAKLHPPLAGLTRTAAGVLAVRVGGVRGEYLAWFRREQLRDVTWGAGPAPDRATRSTKVAPDVPTEAPAGWHELVRDTALTWKMRECAIAKAIGASLADMVLQLRAVRILIAENQLAAMRRSIEASDDPVVIADDRGEILVATRALDWLIGGPHRTIETLADLAACFDDVPRTQAMLQHLLTDRRPWRGELRLMARGGEPGTPVALRADPIPGFDGGLFGVIIMLTDLTQRHAAEEARERLQRTIFSSQRPSDETPPATPSVQALVSAIWANAGVAVSEIADSADVGSIAPLLHEVESATQHAVRLSALLARLTHDEGEASRLA